MNALKDRCEEAFKVLVAAAVGSSATVYTGKDTADKALPCVICSADADGAFDDPPGSGNFNIRASVMVKSNAADTTKAGNMALGTLVADALHTTTLASDLSSAVTDFTAFGVEIGAAGSGQDENGVWVDEYHFQVYCCASDIA